MQRQVIKPQVDVPVVVKLDKGPEGQERDGKFGIDYQYTVNDDSAVMWLPKEARDQIVRSGARPGDEIQIVKTLHGRQAVFSVNLVSVNRSSVVELPREMPAPASNGHYTNGHAHAAAAPAPAPAPLHRPGSQALAGALCAAIDATIVAEDYARTKGRIVAFSSEDIKSMGLTLLINEQKGGR